MEEHKITTAKSVTQIYRHKNWTVVFEERGEIIVNADFFSHYDEMESTITHLESQHKYDLDKLAKAEKRLEELEEWVKKTGHWQYCDFLEGTPYTCKCGLNNLLRGE